VPLTETNDIEEEEDYGANDGNLKSNVNGGAIEGG
jgi:hypothetical protein